MFGGDGAWEPKPDTSNNGTAEPFVRKAERIAQQLHHKDLRIAHLLLAIAMTGRGESDLNALHLEPESVRRCCWRALEEIRPEPDAAVEVVPSVEINHLFVHAATFSNGQELQVSHILRAVTDAKLVGQFGSLIRTPEPRVEDIDAKMAAITSQVEKELPDIKRRLDLIDATQNTTIQSMLVLQNNVGSGCSDGTLHGAVDKLKKRMTNVKTWVVASAAVVITALVIHILRP